MLGHDDTTIAKVWVGLDSKAPVTILLSPHKNLDRTRKIKLPTIELGTIEITNLQPNTQCYYPVYLIG